MGEKQCIASTCTVCGVIHSYFTGTDATSAKHVHVQSLRQGKTRQLRLETTQGCLGWDLNLRRYAC